jgi:hypothetical protein
MMPTMINGPINIFIRYPGGDEVAIGAAFKMKLEAFWENEYRRILYGNGNGAPRGYLSIGEGLASGIQRNGYRLMRERMRPPRRIARRAHHRKLKRGR